MQWLACGGLTLEHKHLMAWVNLPTCAFTVLGLTIRASGIASGSIAPPPFSHSLWCPPGLPVAMPAGLLHSSLFLQTCPRCLPLTVAVPLVFPVCPCGPHSSSPLPLSSASPRPCSPCSPLLSSPIPRLLTHSLLSLTHPPHPLSPPSMVSPLPRCLPSPLAHTSHFFLSSPP